MTERSDAQALESKGAGGGKSRRVDSARLFDGARELLIDHQGECYRLRCTSKGKLILTK